MKSAEGRTREHRHAQHEAAEQTGGTWQAGVLARKPCANRETRQPEYAGTDRCGLVAVIISSAANRLHRPAGSSACRWPRGTRAAGPSSRCFARPGSGRWQPAPVVALCLSATCPRAHAGSPTDSVPALDLAYAVPASSLLRPRTALPRLSAAGFSGLTTWRRSHSGTPGVLGRVDSGGF